MSANTIIQTEIAVIGGGAAGLTAGITAARTLREAGHGGRVTVLEGQSRVGRKLLATGNGRCNLSATDICAQHYHTDDPRLLAEILREIPDAAAYFDTLGLLCRAEENRLYPYSEQAGSVLNCLRRNLRGAGAEERCDFYVTSVRRENGRFLISSKDGAVSAERVILAAGGPAAGYLGASADGLKLAEALGASGEPVFASLTPVHVKHPALRSLKGIRCQAAVRLLADGVTVRTECGEVQFTERGLSGICVLSVSRGVNEFFARKTVDGKPCRQVEISLDLMPDFAEEQLCARLENAPTEAYEGIFQHRLAEVLSAEAQKSPVNWKIVKDWRFTPSEAASLNEAQVTAGGVRLRGLDDGLQCKSCKGLYLAGELLNADGDCGGYNLHLAWASGVRAGRCAAMSLLGE